MFKQAQSLDGVPVFYALAIQNNAEIILC